MTGSALLSIATVLVVCASCNAGRNMVPDQPNDPFAAVSMRATDVVPPSTSSATGSADFRRSHGLWVDYTISFSNVTELTGVKLYRGAPGTNGTVLVNLMLAGITVPGTINGVFKTSNFYEAEMPAGFTLDSLQAAIAAGNVYLMATTTARPTGEIRGALSLSK
jgi:hypothetical protein